jgi:lisH domain-containing protein FOPNL
LLGAPRVPRFRFPRASTMSGGATVEELKDVLRETLENRGALGNVRAHLRAEVSNALEDRSGSVKRPELSDENLVINELIREYLVFNRYRSTLSVLLPETGQPETPPFDREFLAREMRIRENETSKKLPLLYTVLSNAQRGGK